MEYYLSPLPCNVKCNKKRRGNSIVRGVQLCLTTTWTTISPPLLDYTFQMRKCSQIEQLRLSRCWIFFNFIKIFLYFQELDDAQIALKARIAEREEVQRQAQADLDAIKNANSNITVDAGALAEDAELLKAEYEKTAQEAEAAREAEISTAMDLFKEQVKMANKNYEERVYEAFRRTQEEIADSLQKEWDGYVNPSVVERKRFPLRDAKTALSQNINDTIALDETIIKYMNRSLDGTDQDVLTAFMNAQSKMAMVEAIASE